MAEYSCEVWFAYKFTFKVQSGSVDEAIEKAERIAAEIVDEGEKIVKVSVNG